LKDKKQILQNIADKRFQRELRSREKRKLLRKSYNQEIEKAKESLNQDTSLENIWDKWMPSNLKYMFASEDSDFFYEKVIKNIPENNGHFHVPTKFSLIDYPKESYKFIQQILGALITQKYSNITIDYTKCERVDLGAQVILDIVQKEMISFYKKCSVFKSTRPKVEKIGGKCEPNSDIQKLLYSVGSPAIHTDKTIKFPDIIPYKLCIHNRDEGGNPVTIREQKDLDTTELVDYVLDCLKILNRKLTSDKLDDLSTVIGEILINAEEHSTTKNRFSIGYFQEKNGNGNHYGVFRLVILNFGKTIYEKFKDPECSNKEVVSKMKNISEQYTRKKYFIFREFEEETLWTLYALQDGVTSIAPERYIKRGNGSIQFIESFFNIKGPMKKFDDISKMTILSGNTNITFDGSYNITKGMLDNDEYKYMTFNKSGNIEDKPDSDFVKYVDNYFPGTIISAKILFNEDDLI
jgi:hypothetical protein